MTTRSVPSEGASAFIEGPMGYESVFRPRHMDCNTRPYRFQVYLAEFDGMPLGLERNATSFKQFAAIQLRMRIL